MYKTHILRCVVPSLTWHLHSKLVIVTYVPRDVAMRDRGEYSVKCAKHLTLERPRTLFFFGK